MPSLITLLSSIGAITLLLLFTKVLRFAYLYTRSSSLHRYRHGSSAWALVTGASDGIGLGFAKELARNGFNIVLHGRNAGKLDKVKERFSLEFPDRAFKIIVADAAAVAAAAAAVSPGSSEVSIAEMIEPIQSLNITVLVNNVGGTQMVKEKGKLFSSYTTSEIDGTIDLNARFATHLTHTLLPYLVHNPPSLIVNVSSVCHVGLAFTAVYSGTKAYLNAFSRSLQAEMNSEGHDVEVLNVVVCKVTDCTHNNDEPSTFFGPNANDFAKATLKRVGCGDVVLAGSFAHALQLVVLDLLPHSIRAWVTTSAYKAVIEADGKRKKI
ncbi:hypothetical protein MMC14_008323 [Varicellaria rhodocarpa]|nr:hypothetical protein [Varicellaria rhodocarpa]